MQHYLDLALQMPANLSRSSSHKQSRAQEERAASPSIVTERQHNGQQIRPRPVKAYHLHLRVQIAAVTSLN